MRNRRISADEVIDHLTENSTDKKSEMVSQIFDSEGKEFANKVKRGSKTLQENEALTDKQTNSLMTGTRVPELAFRQMRTVFKKVLGYSPIASQDKVRKFRETIMIVKKEDWKVKLKKQYSATNKDRKKIYLQKLLLSVLKICLTTLRSWLMVKVVSWTSLWVVCLCVFMRMQEVDVLWQVLRFSTA